MELSQLNFSHPYWLWAGVAIPFVWIAYFLFYRMQTSYHQLENFIDAHLLPYLLVNKEDKKKSLWKTLLVWTIVWSFLTLSVAGPRWNFRDIDTFSKDQSLVILLDLSESMNATDVKPSRLIRAKQKIEDLINLSKGVKVGLIAFAADPHMITPVTDDKETIRHLLPTLDTDLVYVQGSRLSAALDMASNMLESEPGSNKAILVISDGGFEDATAIITAKKMAEKGIVIHAMGIGTTEGAPIKDHEGNVIKKNGVPVLTKLEKERFSEISKLGNGKYLEAHYTDHVENAILNDLDQRAEAQMALGKKNRIWDERFYLLLIPVLPLVLWWFRRGYIFGWLLIFFMPSFNLQASAADYFKNTEQLGKQAVDAGDYESASHTFQDPYRKGVSCYKAGKFAEAEKYFSQSTRPEVASSAAYNLGNALVQQQKLKEAITAYEDVLKQWPDHIKAKENLELVKKMLEQQKQENQDNQDSENKEDKDQQSNEDQNQKNREQNKENQDKKDQDKKNQDKEEKENDPTKENKNKNASDKKDKDKKQKNNEQQQADQDKKQNEQQPSQPEKQELKKEKDKIPENKQDQNQAAEFKSSQEERQEAKAEKSEEEQNADLWLNRIDNDPKPFIKNKFYIESKKNGTTEGIDPW